MVNDNERAVYHLARDGHYYYHHGCSAASSIARLPDRVARKISVDSATGCWLWQAQISTRGYGRIKWNGRPACAHRVVFHLLADPTLPISPGGPLAGFQLDHLCCVRSCVNPSHLEPVTNAENSHRAAERRIHCVNGHEYTPENTYVLGSRRNCRECHRISRRERAAT